MTSPGRTDLDVAEISLNWLAHVFLSEPEVEFRLGNLLADVVRGAQRESMPVNFLRGVACHHAIDAFTDSHPVVRRSRARISPPQRRFSGVLVDVFYDYFLATHWAQYASMPLAEFTAAFYADIARSRIALPEQARAVTERIMKNDLLGSYRGVEGVERSLRRLSAYLSSRWQRRFALEDGIADLRAQHDVFAADFLEFFPALRSHIDAHPSTASARNPA
jgi:acyl carrier protein phosphodiesterase